MSARSLRKITLCQRGTSMLTILRNPPASTEVRSTDVQPGSPIARQSPPTKLVVLDHIQNYVASHVDCTSLHFTAFATRLIFKF